VQYKFQNLAIYQLGLDFVDELYELSRRLPDDERLNLRSKLERAATSIVLNIAEGTTGQSEFEQNRFLGLALRSYIETVACLDLIERRNYLEPGALGSARDLGHSLFLKLQAFRKSVRKQSERAFKAQASAWSRID
jgi:four helix bundle protein